MIALFLLYFCQCRHKKSDDSKESYCKAIQLLKLKIPIDRTLPKAKELIKKYKEIFNNKAPKSNEIGAICRSPKYNETFRLVAIRILKKIDYIHLIGEKPMLRCIERNLQVFAYTILTMRKEFPAELERIKNDYLAKINNQEILHNDIIDDTLIYNNDYQIYDDYDENYCDSAFDAQLWNDPN